MIDKSDFPYVESKLQGYIGDELQAPVRVDIDTSGSARTVTVYVRVTPVSEVDYAWSRTFEFDDWDRFVGGAAVHRPFGEPAPDAHASVGEWHKLARECAAMVRSSLRGVDISKFDDRVRNVTGHLAIRIDLLERHRQSRANLPWWKRMFAT